MIFLKNIVKKIKYVDLKNIFKLFFGLITTGTIVIDGLNSGKSINKLINKMCNEKDIYNISDIKMPLVIPSVNMCTGEVMCYTSCKKRAFSDNTCFINDAEIGSAVQASCSFPTVFSPCDYKGDKLIDVAFRSFGLMSKELSKYELDGSDYFIKIKSEKVSLLDMSKIDEFYEFGYNETKKFLEKNNIKLL